MNYVLYLGSTSKSRHKLLLQAQIPFTLVPQTSDETVCDWNLSFDQIVTAIAIGKMEHVSLPEASEGERCFVLTADTLCADERGAIFGKPENLEQARSALQALQPSGRVGTAFCLERRIWRAGVWHTEQKTAQFVETSFKLSMSEAWIDAYIAAVPDLYSISGALNVEGYGAQFLQSISGSYTSLLGLPMTELVTALEAMGFFG
jgi:septum formation protein